MKFSDEDQAGMIDAMGETAVAEGVEFSISFHEEEEIVSLAGNAIDMTPPYAIVPSAQVSALSLSGGQNGTVITIDGEDWRIHSIDKDSGGFAILNLGKAGW
ncbi:MAG: hypothetical protein J0652_02620 [Desulfobulbaceae bacterium]|nr:hypothetical protein [Desulfobulbaceae bacterium]